MSALVLLPWLLFQPAVDEPAPEPSVVPEPAPMVAPSAASPAAPVVEPSPVPEPAPMVAPSAASPAASVVEPSLVPVAAPAPVPADGAPAPEAGKFVYAWWAGLTVGISPIPSFSPATVFLGGRTRGPWAVGYQGALSLGGAERYWGRGFIPLAHRHHVTGMRSFGRNRRGLAAVGGGVAFVWPLSPVPEVEARVAVRFGSGKWHLGGLVRLGWDVGHREYAPMPQFGLFIGLTSL